MIVTFPGLLGGLAARDTRLRARPTRDGCCVALEWREGYVMPLWATNGRSGRTEQLRMWAGAPRCFLRGWERAD